ncbi:MAG: phage tail protein [Bacteroidia bacterium]|jgi:hypothetical protein|nr:phage tail protein [Bacteroidia bacterium]
MPNSLRFTLTASDGSSILLLGTPAASNKLIITLTNVSGSTAQIQQGPQQNSFATFPLNQSAVQLYFNGLLSASVVSGITLTDTPNWTLQICSDAQAGPFLNLMPQIPVALTAGESVTLTLTFPQISGVTTDGYFTCRYLNMVTDTTETASQQMFISLRYPPRSAGGSSSSAEIPLQFEAVGSNVVYNQGYYNVLHFRITNTGGDPLAPAGISSTQNPPPQFTLNFIESSNTNQIGALTDNTKAGNFDVETTQSYGNYLKIHKQSSTSPQLWIIAEDTSLSGTTGTVIGTGVSANFEFSVSGIISYMPVGFTTAVLSYSGFPGYPDGQLVADIQIKTPPPQPVYPEIDSLSVSAYKINVKNAPQNISVWFNVANVNFYQLFVQGVPQPLVDSIGSNPQTSTVTISQTSVVEVRAWDVNHNTTSSFINIEVDPIPIGTIQMWSGPQNTVPSGWLICDGRWDATNTIKTPDLASRFIFGASASQEDTSDITSLGHIGGENSHIHSLSSTVVNVSISGGSHRHFINFDSTKEVQSSSSSGSNDFYHARSGNTDSTEWTGTGLSASEDGVHSHTATAVAHTHTVGSSSSMPMFYTLYFIMKCS